MAKKLPDMHVWEIPLYSGVIHFTTSRKKFTQAARYMDQTEAVCSTHSTDGKFLYLEHAPGDRRFIVGVFNKQVSTLAHELGHVALVVCELAGIDAYQSSGEPFCYLLGAMVEEFVGDIQPTST